MLLYVKNKNRKTAYSSLIIALAIGMSVWWWSAQQPVFAQSTGSSIKQISLSASLFNSESRIITNGTYQVRFGIYTKDRTETDPYPSNADTGSRLWEETQEVTVKNGIFRVFLGTVTPLPASLNFQDGDYFIGMRIGEDSEMTPRKKLGSVPSAVNAQFLQGRTIGTSEGNVPVLGKSGKISIKNLPVGEGDNQLVRGDDSRLGDSHEQNTDIGTDSETFNIGSGTAVGAANFDLTVSSATAAPTLRYNGTTQSWQLSNNGSTFADISSGSSSAISGTGTNGYVAYWTGASSLGSEAQLAVSRGGTGASTLADLITLGTHTTGNYVATITAGNGISGSSSTEGGTPTISLDILTATDGTGATSSSSGFEFAGGSSNQLALIQGCSNTQILKWDETSSVWSCANDAGGGTAVVNVKEGVTTYTGNDTLTFTASDFNVSQVATEATIAIDYTNSGITRRGENETISGTWSFSTALTVPSGGTGAATFTSNGVLYGNSTSAIQATAAGTNGQLLLGVTSGAPVFATMSSDATISNGGVLTIAANAVALSTDTTGNYVATITAGNGISGASSIEGGTPTIAIDLLDSADGTGSTSSISGFEFQGAGSNELTMLQGCADSEILAWDDTNTIWECATVNGVGGINGSGTTNHVAYWQDSNTLTSEATLSTSRGGTGAASLTDLIALSTHTTGNYVASTNTSVLTGLTGGSSGSEGAALSLGLDYSQALSGDVALGANAAVFGQSGIVFEGSGANTAETFISVTNASADRTLTIPDVSGTFITTGDTGSVTSTILADGTIDEVDLNATNGPTAGFILTYDSGGGFTWISNTGGSGASKWTDSGTLTYLTDTADDLAVGGSSSLASRFFFDVTTGNQIIFEGTGANDGSETTLVITNPTADRTVTIPNLTGTVALIDGGQTFTSAVWNGTAIGAQYGGTGINTSASTGVPSISSGTWSVASTLSLALGGTNKAITASAGSVVYSDGDSFELSAVGNATECLVSNGTSAPSWTACTSAASSPFSASGGVISKVTASDRVSLLYGDAADTQLTIENTTNNVIPTADVMAMNLTGNTTGIVTDAVDILFIGGEFGNGTTNTNSGIHIDIDPVNTPSGDEVFYAINIDGLSAGTSANETAINVGTNWDTILNTATLDISAAGAITGGTGITSSGTITFSGLSTAGLVTNTSGGVLGTTATIGGSFITDNSLEEVDLEATNSPTGGYILSYDSGTGGFTWIDNTGGSGSSKWTDSGTITFLTNTSDDLAVGGSTSTASRFFFDVTTGNQIIFEGTGADDGSETTLVITNPTADRTITIPNITGTVVTTGDTGSVTGTMLLDSTIGEIDLNATNGPTSGYILSYDSGGGFTWIDNTGGSGSSKWTDSGTITFLTSTSDDVALGGSTSLASRFFFDVTTGNQIIFEGTGANDASETTLVITNPTADRTITLPNADGTIAFGTGTANQVAYWSATNTLAAEAQLSTLRGGTGVDGSGAANGTLLIGNGAGYTLATLTGTANEVGVSNASGSITLGVPDDGLDFTEFQDTLDLDTTLALNQGSSTWTQNFTGTTTTGYSYAANSLTTGSAISVTTTNAATTNTALSPVQFNVTNSQATLANTNGIVGTSFNFTNSPTIAGNTEYAVRIQNQATTNTTDNAVAALLTLDNADTTATGTTVVTDAILITDSGGSGFTNFLNTPTIDISALGAITGATGIVSSGTITFSGISTGVVINASGTLSSEAQLAITRGGTGASSLTDLIALTTHTTGNYVQSITNGSGISGGNGGSEGAALTLALGALTADWNQTGAFDIQLNNASSELKILESSGATFYGIFDVGDLSVSDKTYTFPNVSGTVITTGDTNTVTGTMISDGTIEEVDLEVTNSPSAGYVLTYDSGTAGFTWTDSGGLGNSKWTDSGTLTYLSATGDDVAFGGSTTAASRFVFDVQTGNQILFEGTGADDASETTLVITNPTADRTITLPNLTGTVALLDGAQTFTSATWNATAIGAQYGGTGLNTSASTGVPSISSGTWSVASTLSLALGGTNKALTASAGSVAYSDGDSFELSAVGNATECLVSNGTSAPSWTACTSAASSPFNASGGVISKVTASDRLSLLYGDAADTQLTIENTTNNVIPTADVMAMNLTGNTTGIVTDGVDLLFIGGEFGNGTTNTNSGLHIDIDPVNTPSGDEVFYAINIDGLSAGTSANETAINVGTNWDTILNTATLDISAAGAITGGTGITSSGTITFSGLTTNSFLYSGAGGALTTTTAPTDGQLLIGSTGAAPVAAALTQSTGITVTNGAGSITIASTLGTSIADSEVDADTLDFTEFEDTLDLDAALTLNQTTNTWSQTFTGDTTTGLTYTASALTSGTAVSILGTGAGQTSSTLLNVAASGYTTGYTGNVANFTGVSTTGASNVVNITTANTTAGNGLNLTANGLTTGVGMNLAHATSAITTGALLRVASTATDAFTTGGLAVVTSNAAFTTTANTAGLLNVSASGTTAGTLVNIASSAAGQTASTLLNVVASGYTTGYTGNVANFTGVGTTGAGNVVNITTANTTAGNGLNLTANGITTGVGMNLTHATSSITTGALLRVASTVADGYTTGGLAVVTSNAAFTTTANTAGLLNVAASGTTAGTVVNISSSAAGQTASTLLNVVASGYTTGYTGNVANFTGVGTTGASNVVNVTSANTTAGNAMNITANGLTTGTGLNINSTGVIATTGSLLSLTANSATSPTGLLSITANGLTSGTAVAIASSSSSAFTGALQTITLSGSNAANTGNLLSLQNTGTANTNTSLLIQHNATGTNNLALRVNDVASDTTPFVIDGTGAVGIGTTAPSGWLDINNSGADVVSTITAADATFDPILKYRTGASPSIQFSLGIDNSDSDKFKIYSGDGLGSGDEFVIDANGVTTIANLNLGAVNFDTDAGIVSWADLPVTSSAASGTVQSYSAQIDTTSFLTVYAQSNGTGGLDTAQSAVKADVQLDATADGLATKVNAGACADGTFNRDTNGTLCVDSTNGRIYYRYGGAWHYTAQTAGFQIPNYETAPQSKLTELAEEEQLSALPFDASSYPQYLSQRMQPGEFLIPYVDEYLEDGAVHGLYARFADVKDKMFETEKIQIADLTLKTDQNISTLAELQSSVDTQLTLAGTGITSLLEAQAAADTRLTTVESRISTVEAIAEQIQSDMSAVVSQTTLLESQIATLTEQVETLSDFYTAFELGSLVAKDTEGNVDLLEGKLKATLLETGGLTIEVVDPDAATIGTAIIQPVSADADSDGTDDETGSDGKSVIVNTNAMIPMVNGSRIFTSFKGNPGGFNWVEKVKNDDDEFVGFKIRVSEPVTDEIKVDWWLVEQKDTAPLTP